MNRVNQPPMLVKHVELERSGESVWRSKCPVCKEGVLLVQRHGEDHKLLAQDNCIACGQRFIYTDIETMRNIEEKARTASREADISVSGYKLNEAQSLTVRVAIQSFAFNCEDQLKQHGRDALWEGYLKRIGEINQLIMRTAQ